MGGRWTTERSELEGGRWRAAGPPPRRAQPPGGLPSCLKDTRCKRYRTNSPVAAKMAELQDWRRTTGIKPRSREARATAKNTGPITRACTLRKMCVDLRTEGEEGRRPDETQQSRAGPPGAAESTTRAQRGRGCGGGQGGQHAPRSTLHRPPVSGERQALVVGDCSVVGIKKKTEGEEHHAHVDGCRREGSRAAGSSRGGHRQEKRAHRTQAEAASRQLGRAACAPAAAMRPEPAWQSRSARGVSQPCTVSERPAV